MHKGRHVKEAINRILDANGDVNIIRVVLKDFASVVKAVGTLDPANEREQLIVRIREIWGAEECFSTSSVHWRSVRFKDIPIGEVKFEELNDEDLVKVFELVIKTYYKTF